MVLSKMCNICKQIPRTSFRVIKNLQIFFRCFSVISFLSSDFTVPINFYNMCKKHLQNLCQGPIFKFSLDFSVFYQFSEEISWSPQICVKNPFSSWYYFSVKISWFPPSVLKDLQNFWQWHRTGTFLPLSCQFFYNLSV